VKRISVVLLTLAIFAGLASLVFAKPERNLRLPSSARKVSENVYYLGKAANGAQGYAFIHRRDAEAKPPWAGGGDAKAPKCYGFLANGARWKTTEAYVTDIEDSATETSLETWDSQVGFDLFGTRDFSAIVDGADMVTPDGKNELYFGAIEDPGVIGVTIVWGYFGGPPQTRRLIEWDMILDDVDFAWGDVTANPTVMDYQNILTHELGHAAGLNDQYSSDCSEVTMYGYGTEGEIKKRDLAPQDITGIKELYR